MLGDQAYGDNTALRDRLHNAQLEYVLSVGAETKVFAPGTAFIVPERAGATGRPPKRPRPDREPEAIGKLIACLATEHWQTVTFRDRPDGKPMTSRFAFVRVRTAHRWHKGLPETPREEWLIAEWPEGRDEPTDYWISNLPADTPPERLARLARLALDDRAGLQAAQGRARPRPLRRALLGGLVSPHRAGQRRPRLSYPGAPMPESPAAGLTLPKAVLQLQPLFKCPTGRCQTCQQPIDLDDVPLTSPARHNE